MATNPATTHQVPSTFPRLDSAVVDPTSGELSKTWYYFLLKFWQLLGGNNAPSVQDGVFWASTDGTSNVTAYSSNGGAEIAGGAQQNINLSSSPHTFTATQSGCLVGNNIISMTLRRPPDSPVAVTSTGGAVFLAKGDVVVASWGVGSPTLTFFPFVVM